MNPSCRIMIDGRLASGALMERLIAVTVTDKEGLAADEAEVELMDWPPAVEPPRDGVLSIDLGYGTSLAFMGDFVVQDVETACLPYTMRVCGKTAAFGRTAGRKERHWDNVTLGALVEQIADENGLSASVAPDLASFTYDWIGQVDESDVAFLDRLAQRHGALFTIKARTLIFARRGAGETPGGQALTASVLTPDIIAPGSCRFLKTEREKYKRVVATWMDRSGGQRREVAVDCDAGGEGDFTFDHPFAGEAEARAAATAKADELKRRAYTFEVTIIGNPAIRGGAPITFTRVHPTHDGVTFLVETATHRFAAQGGYTTQLSGKLKV